MKWSKYQKNIFKNVAEGSGNLVVNALAGSGKTSVIIESLNHLPIDKSWLLVAFNKRIAEELNARAPNGRGDARTLHSLGLRSIYRAIRNPRIEQDKNRILLDKIVGRNKKLWNLKFQISKAVDLCKGYLVDGTEFIDIIMDNHSIDTCEIDRDQFVNYVQKTLEAARETTHIIDFSDMIYLPHVLSLNVDEFDAVYIDEGQDLNNAQIELSIKACNEGGRVFVFSDRNQAIYGWRGAASNAVDKLKDKLNAKELPLPITYRCPKLVVKEAQKFVPDFEARPNAPDGFVDHITRAKMIKIAEPGCFILSRLNAPLIGLALGFIGNGVPAIIQGRDIGANLLNLIRKSRRKTLNTFLNWLDNWEKKELARLRKKRANTETISDKAACMRTLANASHDLKEMKGKIKSLFEDTDEYGKIILSSIHRAKGLQRDVVFMLSSTFRTFNQEEKNINYVSITRSAGSLFYVK